MTAIWRIQANNSVMCGYFCLGLLDFMLKGRSFSDHTNPFCPNKYEKNDKIILKSFQ